MICTHAPVRWPPQRMPPASHPSHWNATLQSPEMVPVLPISRRGSQWFGQRAGPAGEHAPLALAASLAHDHRNAQSFSLRCIVCWQDPPPTRSRPCRQCSSQHPAAPPYLGILFGHHFACTRCHASLALLASTRTPQPWPWVCGAETRA